MKPPINVDFSNIISALPIFTRVLIFFLKKEITFLFDRERRRNYYRPRENCQQKSAKFPRGNWNSIRRKIWKSVRFPPKVQP